MRHHAQHVKRRLGPPASSVIPPSSRPTASYQLPSAICQLPSPFLLVFFAPILPANNDQLPTVIHHLCAPLCPRASVVQIPRHKKTISLTSSGSTPRRSHHPSSSVRYGASRRFLACHQTLRSCPHGYCRAKRIQSARYTCRFETCRYRHRCP